MGAPAPGNVKTEWRTAMIDAVAVRVLEMLRNSKISVDQSGPYR